MSGENFECTIARAQLSSYLAGNELPEETLTALENHLKECTDCAELAEQKRSELQAAISGEGADSTIEAEDVVEESAQIEVDEPTESSPEPEPELVDIDEVLGLNAEDSIPESPEVEEVEEAQKPKFESEPEEVFLEEPLESKEDVEAELEIAEDAPEPAVEEKKETPTKASSTKKPKKQDEHDESNEKLEEASAAFTEEGSPKENPLLQRFKSKPFLKTLALSAALAAVLVTMAVFSKNPTSILGRKANKSLNKGSASKGTEVTPTDPKTTADSETPTSTKPTDPLRGLDKTPLKQEPEGGASRLAIQSAIRTLNGQTNSTPSKPEPHSTPPAMSVAKKAPPKPKSGSESQAQPKLWIAGGDNPHKPTTPTKIQAKKPQAAHPKSAVKKPAPKVKKSFIKSKRIPGKKIIRRKPLKPGSVRVYDPSGRPFSTKN